MAKMGRFGAAEIFVGSVQEGFTRQGHLKNAALIGGDAAATMPVQALAGFIGDFEKNSFNNYSYRIISLKH